MNNHLGFGATSERSLTTGQSRIAAFMLAAKRPVRSSEVAEALGYKNAHGPSNQKGMFHAQNQMVIMVQRGFCTQHPYGSLEHKFELTEKGKAAIQRTRNAAFIREFSKSESHNNEDR